MMAGTLEARVADHAIGRAGAGCGRSGGVSPGADAQGTKDGPLGVGPMPVLSEPLGSSICDHGSAGLACCRPLQMSLVAAGCRQSGTILRAVWPGCPQRHACLGALSTDSRGTARFARACTTCQHDIFWEISTQESSTTASSRVGAGEASAQGPP